MKDNKIIYIRVDANEHIAMGHLMRTLSIAEAVRAVGGECCFITADNQGHEKILERGFTAICLGTVWDDLNSEIAVMEQLIREQNIGCLLLDSYYVTPEYMDTLSKMTRLVYIDDLKAFPYSCKVLINYVIGETGEAYAGFGGELYTGSLYVPLRTEFSETEGKIEENLQTIMVTTGGADRYHFGIGFLQAILADKRFSNCKVTMVVGSKSIDKEYILTAYGKSDRVKIIVDANNMGWLMKQADCIVSAGGTTLYEACACKTPAISYAVADNQITNVLRFHDLGALYYAGDVRDGMKEVIERILERLEYMKPHCIRKEIADKMGMAVDGKGAVRIAEILMKLFNE
ncbi:MAG: UDP-2,4-diacetamido-2,4,6-trideoxy-beta-L-altropyranose hydrolase [Lachnospiraceae bacterium]|nr:UDP-2,4-diacetamido-2,4,6-trideoxy-beta-L-altropyranose hydrolase [Lachnospiraceae bacterium]